MLIGANKHADEQASGVTPVGPLSITAAEAEKTTSSNVSTLPTAAVHVWELIVFMHVAAM